MRHEKPKLKLAPLFCPVSLSSSKDLLIVTRNPTLLLVWTATAPAFVGSLSWLPCGWFAPFPSLGGGQKERFSTRTALLRLQIPQSFLGIPPCTHLFHYHMAKRPLDNSASWLLHVLRKTAIQQHCMNQAEGVVEKCSFIICTLLLTISHLFDLLLYAHCFLCFSCNVDL